MKDRTLKEHNPIHARFNAKTPHKRVRMLMHYFGEILSAHSSVHTFFGARPYIYKGMKIHCPFSGARYYNPELTVEASFDFESTFILLP